MLNTISCRTRVKISNFSVNENIVSSIIMVYCSSAYEANISIKNIVLLSMSFHSIPTNFHKQTIQP